MWRCLHCVLKFLLGWAINTMAALVAVYLVKGIGYKTPLDLCVASLLLGILNAIIRPMLVLLAWPLLLVTLGFLYFVINALLLYFVGYVLRPHFHVDSFMAAFLGGLIISFVSSVLSMLTGQNAKVRVERTHRKNREPGGKGPIIDV
jgi:putative membrane protein